MFIAPVRHDCYGQLLDFDRLYSYPKIPEPLNKRRVIVDSGAFGFLQKGIEYNPYRVDKLIDYHKHIEDGYVLVSPDIPMRPYETMDLFRYYKTKSDKRIQPVLHFRGGQFDIKDFLLQMRFYEEHIDTHLFVSDRRMRDSKGIDNNYALSIIKMIRRHLAADVVIHFFSCGKNLGDIRFLSRLHNISYDTTKYQFHAKNMNECVSWGADYTDNEIQNMKNILLKIRRIENEL